MPAADDKAEHAQGSEELGGQFVADRRRFGLGHRHLRPRTEHALLGHRQPVARLQRRGPQGRQPLHLSIVALNPDDGTYKWHFQNSPHDVWDYDGVNEPVLVDMEVTARRSKRGSGPPQWLLLLPEPRKRRVPLRQAVLRGHLDRPHEGGRRSRSQDRPAVRQPGRAARPRKASASARAGRRQGVEPDGLPPGTRWRMSR